MIPGNDNHKVIYKDRLSGFYFPNHFERKIQNDKEFEKVQIKIFRRINQLFENLRKSKKTLIILATTLDIELEKLLKLKKVLEKLFPENKIFFRYMQFRADKKVNLSQNGIDIFRYERGFNDYDFNKINYEWSFLDGIKLSDVNKSHIEKNLL